MFNVVVQNITPRLQYVVESINSRSCFEWAISTSENSNFLNIFYGQQSDKGFAITLGEKQLLINDEKPKGDSSFQNEKVNIEGTPLDFFETIFWALSRYEEYNASIDDAHGRFTSKDTCLPQRHIENPWGDQLIMAFENEIFDFYKKEIPQRSITSKIIPTFDIDHAYAFKNKPFTVQVGGAIKDRLRKDKERFRYRLSTLLGKGKDPYDTHDVIIDILKEHEGYVFFHLGDRATYDKSISFKNKHLIDWIKKYNQVTNVGIHPSYKSNSDFSILDMEIKRLEKISESKIQFSRQHFLKLSIPKTYKELSKLQLVEDHTMIYHDQPGFRAGTAYPFNYFCFEENKSTQLKIHPVAYMDGTLAEYMECSIDEAKTKIEQCFKNMKPTGGHFECIWHNETIANFGKWKGWKSVLDFTLKLND